MTNFSQNYTNDDPLLEITLSAFGDETDFKTYLDTGCTAGIAMTIDEVQKLKIKLGKPINPFPEKTQLADGTYVASYYYDVLINFKGEKVSTVLYVLNPNEKFDKEEIEEMEKLAEKKLPPESYGLLGLHVLNNYKVTFNGIPNPKIFSFLK